MCDSDQDRMSVTNLAKSLCVSTATVYRWILRGVRGRKLPSALIGGRRFVSTTDFNKFIDPTQTSTNTNRKERSNIAQQELKLLGVQKKAKGGKKGGNNEY